MDDPFAAALDALFSAPGSAAAVYQPDYGDPVAIRVIRSGPDDASPFGGGRVIQATNLLELQIAEVPSPKAGETITIGEETLTLIGAPLRDVEGLTWRIGAEVVEA